MQKIVVNTAAVTFEEKVIQSHEASTNQRAALEEGG